MSVNTEQTCSLNCTYTLHEISAAVHEWRHCYSSQTDHSGIYFIISCSSCYQHYVGRLRGNVNSVMLVTVKTVLAKAKACRTLEVLRDGRPDIAQSWLCMTKHLSLFQPLSTTSSCGLFWSLTSQINWLNIHIGLVLTYNPAIIYTYPVWGRLWRRVYFSFNLWWNLWWSSIFFRLDITDQLGIYLFY